MPAHVTLRRALGLLTPAVAVAALLGAAAGARATTNEAIVKDPKADVKRGKLDIVQASLTRGADGRLRANVTMAGAWVPSDLVASSGPPGSVCMKLWSATAQGDTLPDHLICVTADRDGKELRGAITIERPGDLPTVTGTVSVSRPTGRTVTLRFSQSAIGKPKSVTFVAESTAPGCARTSCIDSAPDPGGEQATLRLRT
jgi:hypothetical protein